MSDLTLFESQFRKLQQEARAKGEQGSKQKALNLNADVFIDMVFPLARGDGSKRRFLVPINIYGPGIRKQSYSVTRKVISPGGGGKNWRLNGELIPDPDFDPGRYAVLAPGDFVVFGLEGDAAPTAMSLVLVSAADAADASVYSPLSRYLANRTMNIISPAELESIVSASPPDHPIRELLDPDLDAALEEAATGSVEGVRKLLSRISARRMTTEALQQARQLAEAIGRGGEVLLNDWLSSETEAGRIKSVTWVSDANAICPWDFEVENPDGSRIRIELKTTRGPFEKPLHISQSEVESAADQAAPRTDLYRIYEFDGERGKLSIKRDIRALANQILTVSAKLDTGITPDSYSVKPGTLGSWTSPVQLAMRDDDGI